MNKNLPVEALQILKQMQTIQKEALNLEFKFMHLGVRLNTDYGVDADTIKYWIENGKSDY